MEKFKNILIYLSLALIFIQFTELFIDSLFIVKAKAQTTVLLIISFWSIFLVKYFNSRKYNYQLIKTKNVFGEKLIYLWYILLVITFISFIYSYIKKDFYESTNSLINVFSSTLWITVFLYKKTDVYYTDMYISITKLFGQKVYFNDIKEIKMIDDRILLIVKAKSKKLPKFTKEDNMKIFEIIKTKTIDNKLESERSIRPSDDSVLNYTSAHFRRE